MDKFGVFSSRAADVLMFYRLDLDVFAGRTIVAVADERCSPKRSESKSYNKSVTESRIYLLRPSESCFR
ncbi:protein of unknown function [Methylocaldum szegediense]|uniref:Uncharacterized protein n=1 Tax=Methylocaldum szegediense TaxID=73780 RepID=A0ABN8X222_9GAMM|nr:protein of unknown function [Methylocaldum szegediense]